MEKALSINILGDVCLMGLENQEFNFSDQLLDYFNNADANIANLESALTHSNSKQALESYYIKSSPTPHNIYSQFQAFSLANNHILDYTKTGLADTIDFLTKEKKQYFGAGNNVNEAIAPYIIEKGNVKVAVLGITRWYNASKSKAGTAPLNLRVLKKQIQHLKGQGYTVVLMPHWGYEYIDYPAPAIQKMAYRLLDFGADIIIGSHPHVPQSYEIYKGKHIYYSLGNFIFHSSHFSNKQPELQETYMVQLVISNNKLESNIVPISTTDTGVSLMIGAQQEGFLNKLDALNKVYSNEAVLKQHFYSSCTAVVKKMMSTIKKTVSNEPILPLILNRLMRINKQDILIKIHSILN